MAILKGNAVVGQSGGPTAAINATLSGVIRGVSSENSLIGKLYGMKNGIEGFMKEDFSDLSSFFDNEKKLKSLEETPSSFLGSCRMKLPKLSDDDRIYVKIFSIFEKYDIKYFYYIGGNDSMDTVMKLDGYAKKIGYEIKIIGDASESSFTYNGTEIDSARFKTFYQYLHLIVYNWCVLYQ